MCSRKAANQPAIVPQSDGRQDRVLHFKACPGFAETLNILERVVAEEKLAAEIIPVTLASDVQLDFPGSPTILVDGEDLFPTKPTPPAAGSTPRPKARRTTQPRRGACSANGTKPVTTFSQRRWSISPVCASGWIRCRVS
jgi:hypothetical protein